MHITARPISKTVLLFGRKSAAGVVVDLGGKASNSGTPKLPDKSGETRHASADDA
jgi:hypothetical protein